MIEKIILLILGAFIGVILKHIFEKKSKIFEQYQNKKEQRYLCIILLMEALLNFDSSFTKLKRHRPDITSKKELLEELEAEYYNMILFASEVVLLNISEFIKNPSSHTFKKVGLAMRKDLWNLKTGKALKAIMKA